ncbi:MAG: nucleotidyltransferase domain-containing protein [Candidatus Nanohaloarchaea archaeon]|nr:nucleotidyltransferase domain-containing protein [Candidatus Nanohaloarchaea archaeon]
MDKEQLKQDFLFLKEDSRVLAVLLFGSHVKGNTHSRSDIDICIVAPDTKPWDILSQVFAEVNTERKNYDVRMFEEMGIEMKHKIIENHEVIWCRDEKRFQEHFYFYQKLWRDQSKVKLEEGKR